MSTPILIGPSGLEKFAEQCSKSLFKNVEYEFIFPAGSDLQNWPVETIKCENEPFLKTLRHRGNVYCIFITGAGDKPNWQPVYVGERKSIGLRDRIIQHLIDKNHRTGSMLEKVKTAVSAGQRVGLSFVKVDPESLRLYVEETIISGCKKEGKLPWNTHG